MKSTHTKNVPIFLVQNPSVYLSNVIKKSILQKNSTGALSPPVYTKLKKEAL